MDIARGVCGRCSHFGIYSRPDSHKCRNIHWIQKKRLLRLTFSDCRRVRTFFFDHISYIAVFQWSSIKIFAFLNKNSLVFFLFLQKTKQKKGKKYAIK